MAEETERLVGVAIIRDGETLSMHEGSHAQLRGWKDRLEGDVEGFMTSTGRFVGRAAAHLIGAKAGQVTQTGRELLSSDVVWNPPKPKPIRSGKRWPTKRRLF